MISIKKITLFIFATLLCFGTFAQQVPINNFYLHNPYILNPAAAGIQGSAAGYMNYRDQWAGLKGAPETFSAGAHAMLTETMGAGLKISQNKNGIFRKFSADLSYSYRISITDQQSLAMGLQLGFLQNNLNIEEMNAQNISDPAFQNSNLIGEAHFQSGFGLHYNWKELDVHLASPLVYGLQEKRFLQTAFALVNYNFIFAKGDWEVTPSVLYRYTEYGISQADINLALEWKSQVWAMAGYRTSKNIMLGGGVFFGGIGLGYVYEINRSSIGTASPGSHEVMLTFESPFAISKGKPLYFKSRRVSLKQYQNSLKFQD